jgi:hypothetical protein
MWRRPLLACLLAAVLSACSAGSGAFGPSTGTVAGHVQLRACGGANRPEQTGCPTRPDADVTLTFQLTSAPGNGPRTKVTTDANGAYRVDLAPGTYSVKFAGSAGSPLPQSFSDGQAAFGGFSGPRQVIVTTGKTVRADFVYTIQLL